MSVKVSGSGFTFKEINPEVLVADVPILIMTHDNIEKLKVLATKNPRQRVRVCAHRSMDDTVHEMIIVMTQGCYIRPHKHIGKGESFHIVEGSLDVVVFDEVGAITHVLSLGDYISGRAFYYRSDVLGYHTIVIHSKLVVIHETTQGPFRPSDSILAPWAPEDKDIKGIAEFRLKMHNEINKVRI